jgi:DNA-binding winged helix-turn-helix (wHTH) protein
MQQRLLKGFYLQDLLIEPANGRVSGPGIEAHLKPKAVEVLLYLAERPFEIIERDDLLQGVWGDNAGSPEALTHAISELRSCCHDHANSPSLIQTVPRRGYRLLQQPRPIDEPEPASETGVFQVPDDGSFIGKLLRRGVVQAGAAYMVFSWLLIQVSDIVTPTLNLPVWVPTLVTIAAIGGFPIVLVLAWMLEQSEGRWFLDRGKQSGNMLSGLERNYLSILVAYGVAATGALAYQLTVGFDVPGSPEATVVEADELLPVRKARYSAMDSRKTSSTGWQEFPDCSFPRAAIHGRSRSTPDPAMSVSACGSPITSKGAFELSATICGLWPS